MDVREQREQEQQCASELCKTIKRVIGESDCTYKDDIRTLYELADYYTRACTLQKVRQ